MKIIELFAGVGGFRLGMLKASNDNKIVWSNQWEPSTKEQHASDIYIKNFGNENHSNEDIMKVDEKNIPNHDILCGGFPCQDYSVARPKNLSQGLEGKKGVLWWEIYRIIKEHKTECLFLENVDRLLLSPSKQKGKDFAIILKCLNDLDYFVEWRVINAAEYGFPQKRRRTFIVAYKKDSEIYNQLIKNNLKNIENIFNSESIFASGFKVKTINNNDIKSFELPKDIFETSESFNKDNKLKNPFLNSGIMVDNKVYTVKSSVDYNGKYVTIKDILIDENDVPTEFYIKNEDVVKWKDKKDKKEALRINKTSGFNYVYKQGQMDFPDSIAKPARTIITSEGNRTASRTTHVIKPNDKFRRLHPIELERLNGFPDNHTKDVSDVKRAFLMGNALVVGIIEIIGKEISKYLK